ncbi:hypothetical protein X777_05971 [Ooceraea biroi]|uniref:Uncharacterized protein n=1 Tax=Ooceraea biroi TaxID=2015173 RepID=A0A026WEQ6_OOCBI|nr:hypothetical protein X777_05971 [Ooceraea biroi]
MSLPRGVIITRSNAARRVIDFVDAAARRRSARRDVRKRHGDHKKLREEARGNCRSSGDEMVHLPGRYPPEDEDQRRANSHDVDKVGRWAATRWVPGGSTGVHQGGT